MASTRQPSSEQPSPERPTPESGSLPTRTIRRHVIWGAATIAAAGKVQVVAIPPEMNVIAEYPIAIVKAAPHPDLARRFVELVKSPAGATALREAGFIACPSR